MRIWFDISNSPHVNFFGSMIRELQLEHEIIITCRPLANTIELLNLHGFPHQVVGIHYGRKLWRKVYGYPIRIVQLCSYLRDKKPDVAISHSSFHSPIAAALLGCRSIYLNDNEHAVGNIPSFIFADTVMVPEFLDRRKVRRQGARDKKIVQYPGVKEGIYLWQMPGLEPGKPIPGKNGRRRVFVRPEPSTAQYYKGSLNFLDDVLLELRGKVEIVVSPRGKEQAAHYESSEFSGITVLHKPMPLAEIVNGCSLFIGAGGTMTREMAVLGIPTISVYQGELLDVDRYLIENGQMIHRPELTAELALDYLDVFERKFPRAELLEKGKEAYALIKAELLRDGSERKY